MIEETKPHTIVVDNFFHDLEYILKISKELEYNKPKENEEHNNWAGVRTKSLHLTHPKLFQDIVMKILGHYYPQTPLTFKNTDAVFSKIKKGDKGKTHFHYDVDTKIAAVIYLSKGGIKTGTTLFNNNKEEQVIVSNDINTMVAYDGMKYHGATNLNLLKNRLTLNIFIREINIE